MSGIVLLLVGCHQPQDPLTPTDAAPGDAGEISDAGEIISDGRVVAVDAALADGPPPACACGRVLYTEGELHSTGQGMQHLELQISAR